MGDQVPSIGRVVHYVMPSGKHRPAFIVQDWPNAIVNLQVLLDGGPTGGNDGSDYTSNLIWKTSIRHDEDAKAPNTWHWPERV